MSKIRCFKCNGKGVLHDVDLFPAVFTFGLTALIQLSDPDDCDACDGKGYLLDNEEDE